MVDVRSNGNGGDAQAWLHTIALRETT